MAAESAAEAVGGGMAAAAAEGRGARYWGGLVPGLGTGFAAYSVKAEGRVDGRWRRDWGVT